MLKTLKDKDLLKIVESAVKEDLIDDQDQYLAFLEDLGTLVANHFGGECSHAELNENNEYTVSFSSNDSLPEDGGVFKEYGKDTPVSEWMNQKPQE